MTRAILLIFLFPALSRVGVAEEGPLSVEQAARSFQLEKGLQIEAVAAEPIVVDPVAICFDAVGRLYVAEGRSYPYFGDGPPPRDGVIALLENENEDGRFEKRTVFADGLTFPNGLTPWRGGIFVTCAPDIFYFKDTDGDGVADMRRVALTGFGIQSSTEQLRVSHPTLGLDGWIYVTSGLTGATVTSPLHPDRPAVVNKKNDGRFHPDTLEYETRAGEGQFGLAFDVWGNRFICSNRKPLMHVVLQPGELKRNPGFAFTETVQEVSGAAGRVYPLSPDTTAASYIPSLINSQHSGTFTSACGILIYNGDALTLAHKGNAFICEPAQNLVQRKVLEPHGSTFKARSPTQGRDFLASPDQWFRPVFTATGPDGALYVCDMVRKFVDHPHYLPESARVGMDFRAGKPHGRIWRVTRKDHKPPAWPTINHEKASNAELWRLLGVDNNWTRLLAHRLLIERDAPPSSTLDGIAERRVLQLHQLARRGISEEAFRSALADPHPRVVETALRLGRTHISGMPDLLETVRHGDDRIHFAAALEAGKLETDGRPIALAYFLLNGARDKWTRAAVFSSLGSQSIELLEALPQQNEKEDKGMEAALHELGRMAATHRGTGEVRTFMATHLGEGSGWSHSEKMMLLKGLAEGAWDRQQKNKENSPLIKLALGNPIALESMKRLFVAARNTALGDGDIATRIRAVKLLAYTGDREMRETLLGLLEPSQHEPVQLAAVKSLSNLSDPAAMKALLSKDRWRGYRPSVRTVVVEAMFDRTSRLPALMDALETGTVPVFALTPVRQKALRQSKDPKVGPRAKKLFANLQKGNRMKAFEVHKSVVVMSTDTRRGEAVFMSACSLCHTRDGRGHDVGPDLTGLRNQPAETLLLHILVPNHEVVASYTMYELETQDGQSLAGLMAAETETNLTLKLPFGLTKTLSRNNIKTVRASGLSLMPDELEKTMTRQELADLLAYLKQ